MKKRLAGLLTVIMLSTALFGCSNLAEQSKNEIAGVDDLEEVTDLSTKKVGVFLYKFTDDFMKLYAEELDVYLKKLGFADGNINFYDGYNDQSVQIGQIKKAITDGVDVIIANPVNASSSSIITDMATAAGIPLIYINREPDGNDESRWEEEKLDVTYVGCDARQSGTYQGEIITSLGFEKVDLNGDGVIQYFMIEGDPENIDSEYRTEHSIKALKDSGWEVECLYDAVGNYHKATAQQLVQKALISYPDVEVIFCNNDAMALGALESIKASGRTVGEDIYLVGVDALSEALDCVESGSMTGTVFNDYIAQSHSVADAAVNFITGEGNAHYIGCNYVKVTSENAKEIKIFINN